MITHGTRFLCVSLTLFLTASCAVGPDFMRPAPPLAKSFTEGALPGDTTKADAPAGASQHFLHGQAVEAEWWKQLHSPELNVLVEQALRANPDLAAAKATLVQAQETARAQAGTLYPSVDGNLGYTRQKVNGASFGIPNFPSTLYTLYNASVSVSYGIDVFGGERRALEATDAETDYARFELEAAYLSLTANVVTSAITLASLHDQIATTEHTIDIEKKALKVLQAQFDLGGIAKTSVLEQRATLAQSQALLPPLEKQRAQARAQLGVYLGRTPDSVPADAFTIASLHLPENLPVALPSSLAAARPDIRAAEAQLHVASADVGVATANMLPQISLTGSYGDQAGQTNRLFTGPSNVWSLGGSLLQPIFRGGTLLHQKRAAVAAFDKARAQYESTVLNAFANVSDALRAVQYDADALKAGVDAERAASQALDLAQAQYKDGAINYPQLLDVEHTYQQARLTLVQAQALRLADTVALYQSLGGGRLTPAPTPVTQPVPEKKP